MTASRALVLLAALVASLLPAVPASATHPCSVAADGRQWDGVPDHSHDGCSGGVGSSPAVSLGPASDGTTVTVGVGDVVSVRLAHPDGERWNDVDASEAGALFRTRAVVGSEATTALFHAERTTPGEQLVATTDTACRHAEPACLQPTRSWGVTVVVVEGSAPADSPACRAEPRSAPPAGTVDVVEGVGDGAVTIRVGTRLRVFLSRCESDGGYRPPTSSSDGPLLRESAVLQQPGSASAVFLAVRTGSTSLTAATDVPCRHRDPACAPLPGTWSLQVEVVETPPPGPPPQCVTYGIPSGTDHAFPDVTTVAGRPVVLAFGAPADTATVTLTRTSPEPRAVVRSGSAVGRRIEWSVSPTVNTTLEATSEQDDPRCGPVVRRVLVAPAVSLTARRNGVRDYAFSGRVFPARGQLVTLYRAAADGTGRTITAQTRVAADGSYAMTRRFLRSGQFVLHVEVAASSTNTRGESAGRPTVVH